MWIRSVSTVDIVKEPPGRRSTVRIVSWVVTGRIWHHLAVVIVVTIRSRGRILLLLLLLLPSVIRMLLSGEVVGHHRWCWSHRDIAAVSVGIIGLGCSLGGCTFSCWRCSGIIIIIIIICLWRGTLGSSKRLVVATRKAPTRSSRSKQC